MSGFASMLVYAGATVIVWGFWGFFGKLALQHRMPPLSIFLAEAVIVCILACVALLIMATQKQLLPWQQPWNGFGFLSGIALAVGIVFYYLALQNGRLSLIVPLTAIYPGVTVLLGFLFLGDYPTILQWAGLVLVVIGTGFLLAG